MTSSPSPTAQQLAHAKLTEWLGHGWEPTAVNCPSTGWHGTRKGAAESIMEEGFTVPDTKVDGTRKRRKNGRAVYFFVETSRSLATGTSGHQAASLYAIQRRGWKDAMIITADFQLQHIVDMDAWPHWQQLLLRVTNAIEHDGLTNEEKKAGHENNIAAALTLVEHALDRPVEAVLFWADDLPVAAGKGYHSLAVRPPHEGRVFNLRVDYPKL